MSACSVRWLAISLLLAASPAQAIESLELFLGDMSGAGWRAQQVVARLTIPSSSQSPPAVELRVAKLAVEGLPDRISGLQIRCPTLLQKGAHYSCRDGTIAVSHSLFGELRSGVAFDAGEKGGSLRLTGLKTPDMQLDIRADFNGRRWSADIESRNAGLATLSRLAGRFNIKLPVEITSGNADLHITASGRAANLAAFSANGSVAGLSFSDAEGLRAGEQLDIALDVSGRGPFESMSFDGSIKAQDGELYVDPVYLAFAEQPLLVAANGGWSGRTGVLKFAKFNLAQAHALDATGKLEIDVSGSTPQPSGEIKLKAVQFPAAYENFIKPFAPGSIVGDLDASGRISGRITLAGGRLKSLEARLQSITLNDRLNRFSVDQLQGDINWSSGEEVQRTTIGWKQAQFYRIDFGKTGLAFDSTENDFRLADPATIPVMDGSLRIDEWQAQRPGTREQSWRFDAVLTPVTLSSISNALNWPPLAGKLSGVVPKVTYRDELLEIGGVLLIKAFDGEMTVRNLRLEQPLGIVPRLQADIDVRALDLKTLTRTFSFGRIEGLLEGRVHRLRMEQWRPVSFDARFATPEEDRSRHRISQRALDNLTSIGGGVSGALSRSFLRFFEDFPYDRLGLSCRLQQSVCEMGGAGPAPGPANGYYIVKGSLLPPRVNVVGYADRVDWGRLIDQLKAAIEQGPTTEPPPPDPVKQKESR